jgi:hypothetical protein
MKLRLLLLGFGVGLFLPAMAQPEVDVTKLLADTKTFIFNDNKHTVKSYVLAELQAKTTCCGTDRIYLEVRIDPSGYVLDVKPLNGKVDCYKSSAIDIVKNIKWDTRDFKGPKSVYFEIKPEIECVEGRDNAYRPIEVFNNEIAKGAVAPAVAVQPAAQPAQPQPAPVQPAPVQPAPSQPVAQQQPAAPAAQPEPAVQQPAARPQPDPAAAAAMTPMVATAPATPSATVAMEGDKEARAREDAARQAKEQELAMLKEQMEKMRIEEEKKREQRLAAERAKAEKEAARQQASASRGSSNPGGAGGLFLDDAPQKGDKPGSQAEAPQQVPMSEEERIQQEIRNLEEQKRQLSEARRQREEEARRRQQEEDRASQDLLRIEEEIVRKQEEAAQRREQMELDRMEQDRRRAEEESKRRQDEYQRIQEEIRRLQAEAERKVAEVEKQNQDASNLARLRQAREQEITLERELRRQQTALQMEQTRRSLLAGGNSITSMSDVMPDLSATPDSDRVAALMRAVVQLQGELAVLQGQIRAMGGTPATAPVTPGAKPGAAPSRPRSAADDQSWKGFSYQDPDADPALYKPAPGTNVAQPKPQSGSNAPGYRPGAGFSPDPSHQETHANVPGPEFGVRTYAGGNEKMKEIIKTKLKDGGVCGLGQALFSVTLSPAGDVLRHSVLAANTPLVEMQLNSVIPTLKFNAVDSRYSQTVYLEFKAEILCDGAADKVNLQGVENIIRN